MFIIIRYYLIKKYSYEIKIKFKVIIIYTKEVEIVPQLVVDSIIIYLLFFIPVRLRT